MSNMTPIYEKWRQCQRANNCTLTQRQQRYLTRTIHRGGEPGREGLLGVGGGGVKSAFPICKVFFNFLNCRLGPLLSCQEPAQVHCPGANEHTPAQRNGAGQQVRAAALSALRVLTWREEGVGTNKFVVTREPAPFSDEGGSSCEEGGGRAGRRDVRVQTNTRVPRPQENAPPPTNPPEP